MVPLTGDGNAPEGGRLAIYSARDVSHWAALSGTVPDRRFRFRCLNYRSATILIVVTFSITLTVWGWNMKFGEWTASV